MKKSIMAIFTVVTVLTIVAFVNPDKKVKQEQINMNNFHLVDFVGWNTNIEVLAHYHTDDVKVFGDGWTTHGMKEHETMLKKSLEQMPNAKVIQHSPNVAKGQWTGVVGITAQMKMATVAKWRDGKIAEEYLFYGMLPASQAASMQPSAKPIARFASDNDKVLAVAVDVQPNWSCTMDEVNGKRTAYFIKTINGKEVERMVFQ